MPVLRGDFAMMQLGPQGMVAGEGPFESRATPPAKGVAFYVNDFVLSDPRPWKIPASWEYFPEWKTLRVPADTEPPVLRWETMERDTFQEVFDEIMAALADGELQKAVPVVTERAVLEGGSMASLLAQTKRQDGAWLYGFQNGDVGFAGRTPERLFTVRDGDLHTMALAGTAPPEAAETFEKDPKERLEHRMVVQDLLSVMGCFGEVKVSPRRQLDVGGMLHFLTNFEVALDAAGAALDLNRVLRAFHPTPAVGVLPRSAEANSLLRRWRGKLKAPAYFGAPFGVKMDDTFHAVVGIRNVSWDGTQVALPSGCGILQGSVAEKEWRELELKREWVKRAFSLG
jgi:menaquinone-specific isochorismate synthase